MKIMFKFHPKQASQKYVYFTYKLVYLTFENIGLDFWSFIPFQDKEEEKSGSDEDDEEETSEEETTDSEEEEGARLKPVFVRKKVTFLKAIDKVFK